MALPVWCTYPRCLLVAVALGGAYIFSAGEGSRTGFGLNLARIAISLRMRSENGWRSFWAMSSSSLVRAAV